MLVREAIKAKMRGIDAEVVDAVRVIQPDGSFHMIYSEDDPFLDKDIDIAAIQLLDCYRYDCSNPSPNGLIRVDGLLNWG